MDYKNKTSITIENYNQCARSFEAKFMDLKFYKTKLSAFVKLLPIGARILDLGCGPGNIAKFLHDHQHAFVITGIDLSEEMLTLAKQNVPSAVFLKADIARLPPLNQTFDAVIAAFCIVHLSNSEVEHLIHDVSLLLQPGGLLYISCIEGDCESYETTSFSQNLDLYFNFFSESYIRDLLHHNNFTVTKLSKQEYPEADGGTSVELFFYAKKQ